MSMLPNYDKLIRKCKPVSRDAQLALVRRWRETGELRYRDKVITANLVLALHMALKNRWYANVEVSDLVQLANLALLHAIERFDPDRGVAFSTFAGWWIRSFHTHYIMNQHPVRMNTSDGRRKLMNRRAELLYIHNLMDPQQRMAMREVLAEQCDARVDEVEACEAMYTQSTGSVDRLSAEHDPSDAIDEKKLRTVLKDTLDELPQRTQAILKQRFVDEEHYHVIGSRHACSRERVRKDVIRVCAVLKTNQALASAYA